MKSLQWLTSTRWGFISTLLIFFMGALLACTGNFIFRIIGISEVLFVIILFFGHRDGGDMEEVPLTPMLHSEKNKIIFLDVDGVINIGNDDFAFFNPICLKHLERIVIETDAWIVISSSWRSSDFDKMKERFMEKDFTEFLWERVIGITTRGYQHTVAGSSMPIVRGNEIKHWVDRNLKYPWHADPTLQEMYSINKPDGSFKMMHSNRLDENFTYVILDDDSDMLYEQRNNFIQTDPMVGITELNVLQSIAILNNYI